MLLNRYRIYLQVTSLFDIMTYDLKQIHPDIMKGNRIPSQTSTIYWVDFPTPPKKAKKILIEFITNLIIPYTTSMNRTWNEFCTPMYHVTYFTSRDKTHLYHKSITGYIVHDMIGHSETRGTTYYLSSTPILIFLTQK
jgi:hypothetical protein